MTRCALLRFCWSHPVSLPPPLQTTTNLYVSSVCLCSPFSSLQPFIPPSHCQLLSVPQYLLSFLSVEWIHLGTAGNDHQAFSPAGLPQATQFGPCFSLNISPLEFVVVVVDLILSFSSVVCQLSLFACVLNLVCFCLLLSGLIRVRRVVVDLSLYVDYLSVDL